jgi:tRNA(fMet)-specific endonuclease VapC
VSWLLDTNALVHAQRGRPSSVREELVRRSPDDVAICSISVAELWYGTAKLPDAVARRRAWGAFLAPFLHFDFDRAAAETHGDLRYTLRHEPIGDRDLMLAAIALANGFTVVTSKLREFRRVPGLGVEDWTRGTT